MAFQCHARGWGRCTEGEKRGDKLKDAPERPRFETFRPATRLFFLSVCLCDATLVKIRMVKRRITRTPLGGSEDTKGTSIVDTAAAPATTTGIYLRYGWRRQCHRWTSSCKFVFEYRLQKDERAWYVDCERYGAPSAPDRSQGVKEAAR